MVEKMNEDIAETARAVYDTFVSVRSSLLGKRVKNELERIKSQSIKKSFRGKTPEDLNSYLEARGAYQAVLRIERLFEDIRTDNEAAVEFLTRNVKEAGTSVTSDKIGSAIEEKE